VFRSRLDKTPEEDMQPAIFEWMRMFSYTSTTWESLAFLREATDLPLLVKGVVSGDDAALAVEAGVDGIIVSNHGGRQVDGSIATLDALPSVKQAVPDGFPVLMDSGIRSGADALKALALGADAILLGRPYIWGLGVGGEEGVRQVLRGFLADLELTFALAGFPSLEGVDAEVLTRRP
jgi:isopentenyl diphosphate isomerase/L-lactate dehydrogenase-like FMN-dependent dehydrogenase